MWRGSDLALLGVESPLNLVKIATYIKLRAVATFERCWRSNLQWLQLLLFARKLTLITLIAHVLGPILSFEDAAANALLI